MEATLCAGDRPFIFPSTLLSGVPFQYALLLEFSLYQYAGHERLGCGGVYFHGIHSKVNTGHCLVAIDIALDLVSPAVGPYSCELAIVDL
jgi:hypothetical protein